jgi:thioester reductase-like protein
MSPGTVSCAKPDAKARLESMRRDAVLPADIAPPGPVSGACAHVLLTGATGFLGRQVLRELLADGATRVSCLIRAGDDRDARSRLDETLRAAGIEDPAAMARADAVRGDTSQPLLGMADAYLPFAARIDAIYHCAAEVSWVKSYALLRRTNVLGALEVIRFACATRAKPVTFVSSLAVCFARALRERVDESTDMAPWLESMPLGYAQSKCVAESLLRQASARGLPVTIVRAGLLAGDTVTGRSNPGDVLSALIEGCVAQGVALDIDWHVDSIPVDYAARAIVALARARKSHLETFHVRHSRPRHWRELVLWLNLFGYPVRLMPTGQWNAQVFEAGGKGGALSSYRRFFTGHPGARPFETYISTAQEELGCDGSHMALAALGIEEPALDTPLLRRYVDHYARIGALPPHPWHAQGAPSAAPDARLQAAVAVSLGAEARDLRWEPLPFDASAGILNEIASIRTGTELGMARYRVRRAGGESLDVVVKAKAQDTVLHALIAEVAANCDAELGRALGAFPEALGLRRSHLREPALYRDAPECIARYMPRCHGVAEDAAHGRWSVAMEHLADARFVDAAEWRAADIDAAIAAAADIHSAWYRNDRQLQAHAWAAPEITAAEAARMARLWHGLANFAAPWFASWAGPALTAWHTHLAGDVGKWWHELAAMPRTLIHNDFNSRNLALIRGAGPTQVRVLDWELARVGVPQHDLAELLCFVLPEDAGHEQLERWIEMHRAMLSERAAIPIPRGTWKRGFLLALQQLLVERLPLYTMVHRFKPQPFLPRAVRNWARLYDLGLSLASAELRVRVA